ncbi:hypothetical protein [Helicobacter pylori]|uniref:hypothetical protein n=1 Tax=Helicobacter pylori TaxID=210 RepID=UPI0019311254
MTTMLNKYAIEFLKVKFREIIRYFSMIVEASKIAKITRISRVTINKNHQTSKNLNNQRMSGQESISTA